MSEVLRVIGGALRGRKIIFLEEDALRPTPNRVRETLFNWLSGIIVDADCLDAFAGSGALGFEALSRGAKHVVWVENSLKAAQHIRNNREHLKLNVQHSDIVGDNVLTYLSRTPRDFDIIFLDPPFHQDLLKPCLSLIAELSKIKLGGYIYIESASSLSSVMAESIWPERWEIFREKKAGNVYYGLIHNHPL